MRRVRFLNATSFQLGKVYFYDHKVFFWHLWDQGGSAALREKNTVLWDGVPLQLFRLEKVFLYHRNKKLKNTKCVFLF